MCHIKYRQLLCPCEADRACPQNKIPILPPLVRHQGMRRHMSHPKSLEPALCRPCADESQKGSGRAKLDCSNVTEEVVSPPRLARLMCPACRVSCGKHAANVVHVSRQSGSEEPGPSGT